jgi:hypothetical protein
MASRLMGARCDIKAVSLRWGLTEGRGELEEHVAAAHDVLTAWLDGANEYRHTFTGTRYVEQAIALTPLECAWATPPHDDEHRYIADPEEIPGTADLIIAPNGPEDWLLIEDHKTGDGDFSKPIDHPQLLTLALAAMRWTGIDRAVVAVLHARRRGLPKVYADQVTLKGLAGYETRLAGALARIGDGSMRPGRHCTEMYCPARSVCPARDSELLARAGDVLTGLTAAGGALSAQGLTANDVVVHRGGDVGLAPSRKLGLLYDVVRKAEALAARSRVELRSAIEAGALVETSDGVLTLRSQERESLSKTSVVEAYGKLEGARVLDKLRQDGAVKVSQVRSLSVEKERGR